MNQPKKVVLFINTKKKTGNDPDYTGHIKDGETIINRLALWINTSKAGENYLSGYLNPPGANDNK